MSKNKSRERILLVDTLERPDASNCDRSVTNYPFSAIVACVDPEDDKPRNWSLPYTWDRFPSDTGGCSLRAWEYEPGRLLASSSGPEIRCGKLEDYEWAAKALKSIDRRRRKIESDRGTANDPTGVEDVCRWIESTGVKRVYRRVGEDSGWLSKGDWKVDTVGDFLGELRTVLRDWKGLEKKAA